MTLIELIVSMSMLVFIIGGGLTAYAASAGAERGDRSRAESLLMARTGLGKMSRELRSAIPAASGPTINVSATSLSFQKYLPGTLSKVWVLYQCTSGSCRRAQSAAGGSVPASATAVIVPGLTNSDVFALSGTNYVTIKVSVRDSSEIAQSPSHQAAAATLVDGVALRNFSGSTM
ncbi:MAG: hypothetical protein QOG62_690 [Thermoleophilaceae bacterium]|nr:hypothetical protein [Thermoleophilaceae bacterium]